MILAGDIGGTKTRLALYRLEGTRLVRGATEKFSSTDASGLSELALRFLKSNGVAPIAACFGIPGPVRNGHVKTTNLPWELDERQLKSELGIPRLKLVNDLEATAAAVPHFAPADLVELHRGNPAASRTVSAVLAPGTGLGQAYVVTLGGKVYPLASEGGHVHFAALNDLEFELVRYLKKSYERVSAERILSGPGLVHIYQFLRDEQSIGKESAAIAARMTREDPASVIAESGMSEQCAICTAALDMFCSILGAIAGDVMLTYMASGGVYLGGGIPPKILARIQRGGTKAAYLNKGRLSPAVQDAPLYVIRDDHAALLGAASIAMGL